MVSEYFIDSPPYAISHSSDRLPDSTFNISYISMDVQIV